MKMNRKTELFDRTQKRLTLRYSLLVSLFLLLFAGIVYVSLYIMIWSNQEQRLRDVLDQEIRALEGPLYKEVLSGSFAKPMEREFPLGSDQAFYYLIGPAGQRITGAELQKDLGDQVLALIPDSPPLGGFRQIKLSYSELPALHENEAAPRKQGTYMMGSRVLYRDGQMVGTLYAGKEVTFQKQLFHSLLLVLLGAVFLFLALTVWLGRMMSGQAMLPIRQSYMRQQQFVADASHELRTPLSILLSSIEALDMEQPAQQNSFTKHVWQGMKEEVQRMRRLSDDLLLLARSDSEPVAHHLERVNMRELALQTLARMENQAKGQQVSLEAEVPEALEVQADTEKLTRLLVILLENAIKYNTPGGLVRLTAAPTTGQRRNTLLLTVEDTGIGIPEEDRLLIFERFYRADRSRQKGGHGLGLSIAKEIATGLGGSIQVQSEPGKGSVFRVELPLPE